MKNIYIVANWKSNKTEAEALEFFSEFSKIYKPVEGKGVIICPSFTSLSSSLKFINENNLDIKLGAQNVSPFELGAFTGEVNSAQIKEFCSYCIVGHSERRGKFSEDLSMINDKIRQLEKEKITPIVCISQISQLEGLLLTDDALVAYEPLSAIGSGKPDSPQDDENIAKEIKAKVLYGGSVNEQNVAGFTSSLSIDGVLVGEKSLDPQSFLQIINNA